MISKIESGLPSVEYYAPNYRIEVEDHEIDQQTKGDVLQVKVTMQRNALTSFNISINNWDDRSLSFKYSDSDTFFIGRKIHIRMGYADKLVHMAQGKITSMSVKFPESGSPTIDISGTDSMFGLKGSKPKDKDQVIHTNVTDWQIAQRIAARNDLPIKVTKEGPTHPRVVQKKDQDDATFLLDRARRVEFDVFMRVDPENGKDTLHFVSPTDGRDGRSIQVYEFEWGKSLINFSSQLSAKKQVCSVTVRGWDDRTKKTIQYTATEKDLPKTPGNGTNGPAASKKVTSKCKEEFVVDAAVVTQDEAKRLAVSRLVERAYGFQKGSGSVIGLPELRPGDNVHLKNLGHRFDGQYRISKVDHTIGNSGFQSRFDVERLREGGKA